MRKRVACSGVLLVLVAATAAMAQPIRMHGMMWNPTWLHGSQERDVNGDGADDWFNDNGTPIWWKDSTPRYRAIRVWTGGFDEFTTDSAGVKTPANPDGNPLTMVNYNMPYGGGNMWNAGSWANTYGSFGRGGSKQEYFYVGWRGFWRTDRRDKDPVSAAHPVALNFDFEGDVELSDMMISNWASNGQPGSGYYYSGAKDVTIQYRKEADAAWSTLGTFQINYPSPANT